MNPFAMMNLNMQMTSMMCEAQTVMGLRIMGMSGAIATPKGENDRMMNEKPAAMIDAFAAGTKAALAGKAPEEIMSAAIKPLSSKVTANRKRLMK